MGADIFALLADDKRKRVEEKKRSEEASKSPANSKAGKFQTNQGSKIIPCYKDRQARGDTRMIYNEGVRNVPGSYNLEGKVEFQLLPQKPGSPFQCGL